MNPTERSISVRLALVFALRMFGLFIVLPILAPYAHTMPLGWGIESTPQNVGLAIGLAMGMYGLTQAVFYIPYGLASDRIGRKPMIVMGLLLFAAGAFWAAQADTLVGLIAARAIQGMGAVSSVVMAMISDHTRDEVRTRAMAMVGMSIALTFAISVIAAPALDAWIGMSGVFDVIGILALLAILLVVSIPSKPLPDVSSNSLGILSSVLRDKKQWRLNFGVFVLHAVQMAMWVVVPQRLLSQGVDRLHSSWLYFAVIVISMVTMVPLIIRAEKYHRMQQIMRVSIGLIALSQVVLMWSGWGVWGVGAALLLFFIGFNVLEATQPSLLSKISNPLSKGSAAGVYNTIQALGLFVGSVAGAAINARWGAAFMFVCAAALVLVWALVHEKWRIQIPQNSQESQ